MAVTMVSYEGPMSHDKAKAREPELADKLKEQGYDVHGGH